MKHLFVVFYSEYGDYQALYVDGKFIYGDTDGNITEFIDALSYRLPDSFECYRYSASDDEFEDFRDFSRQDESWLRVYVDQH